MIKLISQGDLVKSVKGRDKEILFLAVKTEGKIVYLADGKVRRVNALKKKNYKHLELFREGDFELKELAERISRGQAVGNKRLKKLLLKNHDNKKQEE